MAKTYKDYPSYTRKILRKSGFVDPPDSIIKLKEITLLIKRERKRQNQQLLESWVRNRLLDKLSKLKME